MAHGADNGIRPGQTARRLTRRDALRLAGLSGLGMALLSACGQQAPAAKPAETAKPADAAKPAESKPADAAKPAAPAATTAPAAAAKPADAAKPAADAKPIRLPCALSKYKPPFKVSRPAETKNGFPTSGPPA